MNHKVTMRDIADRLNISSVTVSKALGDKDGVSDSLKEKIKQVAEEMGYRYNTAAKSMKDGLSYNIGVMIPERFTGTNHSFYFRIYKYIAKILEQGGYYGIMTTLGEHEESMLTLPRLYYEQKIDGLIILGQIGKPYIEAMQEMQLPKIFLDFYDEHVEMDAVVTDNFYGAYELTNLLIRGGHRDIAYVGTLHSTSSIQDRFLGYYKSLLEHRIPLQQQWILDDRDEDGVYIDIQLPDPMPSAFVCNCDQVAHNLINKLQDLGYHVPQDYSVTGFDNDIYATLTRPPLTTVEVDIERMAKLAVQSILKKVSNPYYTFGRALVPGRVIERESAIALTNDTDHQA